MEGRCRQMSLACVGSTRSVPATLGLPPRHLLSPSAQAPGCSLWNRPRIACNSSFRVFHRSADSVGPAFCAFPSPSSSGSQELDGRTLPGYRASYPSTGPASVSMRQSGAPCASSGKLDCRHNPPGRCQPFRISGSLWLETESLFAVW